METTDELPAVAPAPLVLGRYRLGERLGAGGFGTVYAAVDERLRRHVAVKVIPGADDWDRPRGQREALAAARLDHPGVVAVFDAGEDGRARYLISELVHGKTLDRLSAQGVLSDRDVLRIGLALCGALEHAHGRGVVHRDVKPQNVIIPEAPRSAAGVAKLADFGVAHLAGDEPLTRTGDVVGTLAYMAPEQAAGRRVDERADLYSLALVLYEALAGRNPVRAGSPAATARRVGTVLPSLARSRGDLPQELAEAIDTALRPGPEERGTLAELAQALEAALLEVSDEGGTVAPHPLERRALPSWAGRLAGAALAAALAALAVRYAAGGGDAAGRRAGSIPAWPAAAAVFAAVALLPRLGWLAAAAAAAAVLARDRPAAAGLVAVAAAPVPILLRRHGAAWSVPALAPALGAVGLAVAFPALAGRARTWLARAALGALGAWWLLLAEAALHRTFLTGGAGSLGDVLASGALLYAAIWALAAAPLPWLVRGRALVPDVVLAAVWAGALGAAMAAAARSLDAPEPRGLTAGAALAGVLALALRGPIRHAAPVEP
ncbi:serine/threonine-protein kinase [Candidatus Solirubrobacter pratensis]|uniref:serine/threonine-protein kinase n=1 Tax=Candidatus Solirubrobacter pratensis TaxID=1298857 RepID=UPI000687C14F|nr:serine/threonine-protein kinase [Candidatus Solirubrobacter pratensis]